MIPVISAIHGPNSGSISDHADFVMHEYGKWFRENKIIWCDYRIRSNYDTDEYDTHSFFYIFWFDHAEDALAFKLRWA